jgi:predicted alpha/beta superfamily hydrolase
MTEAWQDHGGVSVANSTRFTFPSQHAGVDLEVSVATPALYGSLPDPRPVLYVLDANLTFPMATSVAHGYELLAFGQFPSMVVVGVGYANHDPIEVMSRRMFDLSPTDRLPEGPLAAAAPGLRHGLGGADAFLRALQDEVIPFVEGRYRCDPTERTLAGWSLGGLFGLHVLFSSPELFRRYLLVSPSIWWDERHALGREEAWAAGHDDLAADVFLAAGDREETSEARSWPPMPGDVAAAAQMVTNVHVLADRLRDRRYPSLGVTSTILADEHHTTIFPVALSRGLLHFHARNGAGDPLR